MDSGKVRAVDSASEWLLKKGPVAEQVRVELTGLTPEAFESIPAKDVASNRKMGELDVTMHFKEMILGSGVKVLASYVEYPE